MAGQPDKTPAPRPMHNSLIEMTELVMPNDTNPHGTLSGGRLMHWIDVAGAMAAMRHARRRVVTVAIDEVAFRAPIPQGHMVLLEAIVTCVGRTSMEVRVEVHGEDPVSGKVSHTTTAHLVFVALEQGEPVEVPGLLPESPEEEALHERALARRGRRLELRAQH
jgi:acyl-CoA hydrolase